MNHGKLTVVGTLKNYTHTHKNPITDPGFCKVASVF